MNVHECTLANGLRVITSAMPQVESVSIGVWVGVGGRHESRAMSGVSHFIEHLLFKGTGARSAREISAEIEGHGGYLNAFTQEENTCFYVRAGHDRFLPSLEVLADMYLNSLFDAREVERERGVIVEEIMMYRDQPHQVVQEVVAEALWKDHPLGRSVSGTPDTIGRMTREQIVSFKDGSYAPGNTVVAVAGRVDHDECVAAVERLFGAAEPGRKPRCRSVGRGVKQKRTSLISRDTEQNHLALGFRLFGRGDRRRYALKVLSTVLGGNMSSRLFQIVREKHGLAYSIHSSCHLFRDSGALVVSAGLDRKRAMKALALVARELVRLRDKPVGRRELRCAKDYLVGQLRLSLESTSNQMIWIGENLMSRGKFIPPDTTIEELEGVTAEQVQRVARAVIRRPRLSLAVVSTPFSAADRSGLRAALSRLA